MQPEYLARLSKSVQDFILEVEQGSRVNIEVVADSRLNETGPLGQGQLEVCIEPRRIQLFAPTNGYFPNGAVRHEVLHIHRFHVEGVPKLVLAGWQSGNRGLADRLTAIDNALEHLVIVPLELQWHPERKEHWDAVMDNVCGDLPSIPDSERPLAVYLHWAFLRHVLSVSPQVQVIQEFMNLHGLFAAADDFADRLLAVLDRKEGMLQVLSHAFPEIEREGAAMKYLRGLPMHA
jgi:hypothetical protein